jgi:hypothetical protein
MTQPTLFDQDLARVSSRIELAIVTFFDRRARLSRTFHMDELRQSVVHSCGTIAPDSPGRVMRDLRRRRVIDYAVENRRRSLYRIMEVLR